MGQKPQDTSNRNVGTSRRPAITAEMIAEVPDYPESDKNAWRSSNDIAFTVASAYYNYKYHLEPRDSGYRTPEFMKAWAMVESGGEGSKASFSSDPFQVNVPGDYGNDDTKFGIAGQRKGQKMTPGISALAALEWLRFKSFIHDHSGKIVRYKSELVALQDYHGGTDVSADWGNVMHKVWYAAKILRLTKLAEQSKK